MILLTDKKQRYKKYTVQLECQLIIVIIVQSIFMEDFVSDYL